MIRDRLPQPSVGHSLFGTVGTFELSAPIRFVETQEFESNIDFIQKLEGLEYALWQERRRSLSTPEQLADPIHTARLGLVIPSKEEDSTSTDAKLLTALFETLCALKDSQTQVCFVNWFSQKTQEVEAEQTLYLLQSLIYSATLLDLESYGKMMRSDNIISIAPLDALDTCQQMLDSNNHSLSNATALFEAQYGNLLNKASTTQISEEELLSYAPNAKELGSALLPWIDTQVTNGELSLEKGLRAVLNYIRMYSSSQTMEINALLELMQERYSNNSTEVQAVKDYAIEYNYISVNDEENERVIHSGLRSVAQKDIIDAAEIRFDQEPFTNIHTLYCDFLTGYVAPAHAGHRLTAEIIETLNEERSKDPGVHGIFMVAPINSPKTLERQTGKPAAQVGSIEPRINLLVIVMRDLLNTYITTQMQEEFEDDPVRRLMTIKENFENFAKKTLGVESLPFQIIFERIYGSDKILKESENNVFTVYEPEPAYADIAAIVTPRRRQMVGLLKNFNEIHEKYPKATTILSPWIPRDSSSLAIRSGNFNSVSSAGMKYVDGNWYQQRIEERSKEVQSDEPIKSVTTYGKQLKQWIRKEINLQDFE
jgi:hypothetical protein